MAFLDALITACEVQQVRTIITERQTDISDYSTHLQALQTAFLHALELDENAENRIRQEFQRQLESKNSIITNLQKRVRQAEHAEQTANTIDGLKTELAAAQTALATTNEHMADK